jgi:5-methylcytosine-specific restriction endonuclease McrA
MSAAPERKTRHRKKNIPAGLRKKVWINKFGKNVMIGKCECCLQEISFMDGYECGHRIAEAVGGKIEEDNLRPVCRSCNRSMGTQNMDVFKLQFAAHNVQPMDCH